MFKVKEKAGEVVVVQGLKCHLPAMGWTNKAPATAKPEWVFEKVHARSTNPNAMYWERDPRFAKEAQWIKEEEARKKTNPNYIHPEYEKFKRDCWGWRRGGFWFKNKGKSVYITGQHWYYLSCYQPKKGHYMKFREADVPFFYFWQYCFEDPDCYGMLLSVRRRWGKTAYSGAIMLNLATQWPGFVGGIQSKTDDDAKNAVFKKAILEPYRFLPPMFQPWLRMIGGKLPTNNMEFTSGKMAVEEHEINARIEYRSSVEDAYDGEMLNLYISDECGKLKKGNILVRHGVVKPCLMDNDMSVIGKALYTSTVEEAESGGANFKLLWEQSNQYKKQENGERWTASGLYRYFLPADEAGKPDERFGTVDKEKVRAEIMERRRLHAGQRSLAGEIRRAALTEREMFMVDETKCVFDDPAGINDRDNHLSFIPEPYKTGNFEWAKEIDGDVKFVEREDGRFKVLWMPPEGFQNNVLGYYGNFRPGNKGTMFCGIDPIDARKVSEEHERRASKPSIVIVKGYSANMPSDYDGVPVLLYNTRPDTKTFYEDVIKVLRFYGIDALIENQKGGVLGHMEDRGYKKFLVSMPGRQAGYYGVPASTENTMDLVRLTAMMLDEQLDNIWFRDLLQEWALFDPTNTTKFDAAMACGYALQHQSLLPARIKRAGGVAPETSASSEGLRSALGILMR